MMHSLRELVSAGTKSSQTFFCAFGGWKKPVPVFQIFSVPTHPMPSNPYCSTLSEHIVRIFRVELPRTDTPVDSRAGAVLSFVRADKNGRTRADIENYLGVSRPTARKIIEGLLASGELMRIGKTRAVRYCLSSKNS